MLVTFTDRNRRVGGGGVEEMKAKGRERKRGTKQRDGSRHQRPREGGEETANRKNKNKTKTKKKWKTERERSKCVRR